MSSVTSTRPHPLTAAAPVDPEQRSPSDVARTAAGAPPQAGSPRQDRFATGLRALRVGGRGLRLGERTLMVLGGVLAPVGVIVVLLGWWGASRTPFVFEQVPYLISGGLLGVALVFLGAFLYFTHWLTVLVKEHRAQSAAMVEALERLQDEVGRLRGGHIGRSNGHHGPVAPEAAPVALVATVRGTMSHTTDCVVVAGKADLRPVVEDDLLQPCKLCQP